MVDDDNLLRVYESQRTRNKVYESACKSIEVCGSQLDRTGRQ